MTVEQLLLLIAAAKVTDSGKVEWDNNSLQNIMQSAVSVLFQERGIRQVDDITALMNTSATETLACAINQVGIFFFSQTGVPDSQTIFPALGGGYWIKQTGTVAGVVWGAIAGTLSNQTDLITVLNGKVPTTRTVNGHALSSDVTVTKSDIGLGNVENTALSTWTGSTNITTLGTIGTGTWNGTTISIAKGGTGQTTAPLAINALMPSQTGNNGKFLTTNGTVVSWGTVSGLSTIYTADGTISTARTVTGDTGSGVSGLFNINVTGGGDMQWLGIKDLGLGEVAGILVRPLIDPNAAGSSPLISISVTDVVSAVTYQSNVYIDRYNVALQQAFGTRFRQFVIATLLNEAVYDDSDGYGIAYSTNISSATFGDRTLVPKKYVDDKSKGGLATFSGNGSTTVFNIPHGMISTPTSAVITANTLDAHSAGGRVSSITSTNIVVTTYIAPIAGSSNVKWYWQALI